MGEGYARDGLYYLFRGGRRWSHQALVEEGRKSYRLDASARGNMSGLCDLVVNWERPLLVGNYKREENMRRVKVEFSRGV
jgi:hypothetical protein